MNIEQAKTIAITQILDKLNIKPKKEKHHDVWYKSPLRDERTASFKVNTVKNTWYDFGEGIGGDIIDFVCAYLKSTNESHTLQDALRWLGNMSGLSPIIKPVKTLPDPKPDRALYVLNVKTVEHPLLLNYAEQRGIPQHLTKLWLRELTIHNNVSDRKFFALGFKNDKKGYELRNAYFKGCVGSKAMTFIRGIKPKPSGIHLFEGFMDYLTALAELKTDRLKDDVIVLNSITCLQSATPFIKGYGYSIAYTWMDNDSAGDKAKQSLAEFFETEIGLRHQPMNHLYKEHKDVNAWYMHKLGLE